MPKIRVLKPFTFSHPPHGRQRVTDEVKFLPGDHEVSDDIANHPWIKSGADGRIESAQQAAVRTEREAVVAAQNKLDADTANAHALAAVARLNAAQPGAKATAEEIETELNTPIHQKGAGTDADKPLSEAKSGDENEAKDDDKDESDDEADADDSADGSDAEETAARPKKGTLSRTKQK